MLNTEKNERLTRVGPGTPAGNMLRKYWHPIALASELQAAPLPVSVLGENLVLYRGRGGEPHLLAQRCAHRGTSLARGRIEGEALRCCYHGWLFAADGRCLEQPGEPAGSQLAERVRIAAYPAQDRYGMIWAYLGEGEPPVLPAYDILARADGVTRVAKISARCNYFQVIENAVDPVHTAFLHTDTDLTCAYEEVPQFDCEWTAGGGIRTIAWRPSSQYRRQSEFVFPTLGRVTLPFMKPIVQMGVWTTPNDDFNSTLYCSWFLPLGADEAGREAELVKRMEDHMFEMTPHDRRTLSSLVVEQDMYACESQGPLVSREDETLGNTDRAVVMMRRAYFEAIERVEQGGDPPEIRRGGDGGIIMFDKVT